MCDIELLYKYSVLINIGIVFQLAQYLNINALTDIHDSITSNSK